MGIALRVTQWKTERLGLIEISEKAAERGETERQLSARRYTLHE